MKLKLIILILFSIIQSVKGQYAGSLSVFGSRNLSINGTIISGISGNPIGYAIVTIKIDSLNTLFSYVDSLGNHQHSIFMMRSDSSFPMSAISDSTGNFNFSRLVEGVYSIEVDAFGYEELDTLIRLKQKSISNLIVLVSTKCPINADIAKRDINKNKVRLYLVGSIAPVYYSNQGDFEKKYHIKYYDFGCTPPAMECIKEYNKVVFTYLDNTYGTSWRKEVRKDVIGLKKFL